MPTYAYRCTACSHEFDIFQKFTDKPLAECPECGSPLRKVFQPVGIVFKGSGWYINDSRAPEKDSAKAASPAKDGEAPSKDGGATESTPKAAPAAATPSAPKAPAVAKAAAD